MDSGHHDKAALGEVTIVGDDDAVLLKGGTVEDRHDMTRVGKSQVFHVRPKQKTNCCSVHPIPPA